ncbi:putative ammonium transporter 1 [Mya arenaria]|uniref:putative ammonium transporter 1 n=1 Tax=Mya arenaria TaxID=6604 RepID=UPI0022E16F30|nr:putative ammonium transporter 1 [Mya arenaria]XP_052799001.1 putative ammonium transporter 1 [Mya arenaria]
MSLGEEVDQFFKVIMGMIVMFMQCGFAFYEAGSVRSKNVTNILIKNVIDSFIAGVAYWIFGFALAYGEGNKFIGYSNFALKGVPTTEYANFFFQYSFAASTATIVSGAVAERCEFLAYFVYSFLITGVVYPVATHWYWGGGFLAQGVDYGGDIGVVTYIDFAGSGLVHVIGGSAGFVGAAILGPRVGRFGKTSNSDMIVRGHSVPIAALGGFILLFGFLAFNGGSLGTISNPGDGAIVSRVIVNTIIAASFAAFSSLFVARWTPIGSRHWSLMATLNGALTGMVSVCAGCNVLNPWQSAIMGLGAGVVYHLVSQGVQKLGVDDPLDACALHFGGGVWALVMLAFFHKDEGIFFHWNARSGLFLCWQLAGLGVILLWTVATTGLIFGVLRLLKVLRVPEEMEIRGLDIPKHHEPAYPVEAYGHGHIERMLRALLYHSDVDGAKRKPKKGHGVDYWSLEDKGPYENPEVRQFAVFKAQHGNKE